MASMATRFCGHAAWEMKLGNLMHELQIAQCISSQSFRRLMASRLVRCTRITESCSTAESN